MQRALVVDDDAAVAGVVTRGLEQEGFHVDRAGSGTEAMGATARRRYDLAVLDVNIPPPDGLALCRLLRSRGDDVPILLLTERDRVDDRVEGLDSGADDYLPKPFDLRELLARVRAIRRRRDEDPARASLQVGALELDPATRLVTRDDVSLELTAREFDLLRAMMERAGRVLSRRQLLDLVWDNGHHERVVDVYVGYLRRKVDEPFTPALIETVRGAGYRLRIPA